MALDVLDINHVQITVPKAAEEAAKHFYGHILGLNEIPKPVNLQKRGGAWYRFGRSELHVSVEDVTDNHVSKRHVCYVVPDLAQAEQELQAHGVEIIPDDQPIEDWIRFYVRDPGGNRVEIAQIT